MWCHEIINATDNVSPNLTNTIPRNMTNTISKNVTSTMSKNSDGKKARDKINFIFFTHFY